MAHIHKLIDFTIVAIIVYKKKILLVKHKELKKWLPVGGHIELHENPEEAFFREIEEECGLDVEIVEKIKKPDIKNSDRFTKFLHAPYFLDIHKINDTHRHIGLVYLARAKSNKVKLKKDEHKNIRWFSEKDLNDVRFDIQKSIIFYSKEALKIIK
jgi:ADP-ribose pyrophosphatase YjhB (NUDIX family)